MTHTASSPTPILKDWLKAVSAHLDKQRDSRRATPKPARNRARERARREARQLFRDYELDLAVTEF